jgi:hypothetical protein
MTNHVPQLRTPGVIAAEVGAPLGRVLYILRTRGHLIRPIGRAGCLRLYDRAATEMVREALREMGQRREVASV